MSPVHEAFTVSRGAIFFDRDGVLIRHVHHLHRVSDVELEEGAREAVAAANAAGWPAIVVTNQSVVARGLCDEAELARIHARVFELLAPARIDALYYCPHFPPAPGEDETPPYAVVCDCRKPASGMLRRAAAEHDLDLARSLLIGDTTGDIEAAARAELTSVLVETGYAGSDGKYATPATRRCANVREAVGWWLDEAAKRSDA